MHTPERPSKAVRRGAPRPVARPGSRDFHKSGSEAPRGRPRAPARAAPGAKPRAAGSRSCKAARSLSPPSSAARPILQHYAFGAELLPDAVGRREVPVLFGLGALSNAHIDRVRRLFSHPHEGSEPSIGAFRH